MTREVPVPFAAVSLFNRENPVAQPLQISNLQHQSLPSVWPFLARSKSPLLIVDHADASMVPFALVPCSCSSCSICTPL